MTNVTNSALWIWLRSFNVKIKKQCSYPNVVPTYTVTHLAVLAVRNSYGLSKIIIITPECHSCWLITAIGKLAYSYRPLKNNFTPSTVNEGVIWKISSLFGIKEFLPLCNAACLCYQNSCKGWLGIDGRQKVWEKILYWKVETLKDRTYWYLLCFFNIKISYKHEVACTFPLRCALCIQYSLFWAAYI